MNTVTLLMLLPLSVLTLKTSWCKNYFLLFLKLIECFFNSCTHTVVSLSAFITEHKSLLRCSLICPFLKIPTYLSGRQCKSCLFLKAHRYSFFFFFCSSGLWWSGWSWLNSGQKASVTQQHLFLLLSFSQHAEGHAGSPKGGLLCAPLSIPSLSAEVCSHNAAGL